MKAIKTLMAVSVLAVAGATHAATYDISGSFVADATLYGSPLLIPILVNSGSYDSDLGTGSWNISADVSGMGMGTITFSNTFTMDAVTGLGQLNPGTGCVGNNIACQGVGPLLAGTFNAGGPIVAGVQAWVLTTTTVGTPTFRPTLTETAPAVPVPAAAWLFGSGLLGLAGLARKRA